MPPSGNAAKNDSTSDGSADMLFKYLIINITEQDSLLFSTSLMVKRRRERASVLFNLLKRCILQVPNKSFYLSAIRRSCCACVSFCTWIIWPLSGDSHQWGSDSSCLCTSLPLTNPKYDLKPRMTSSGVCDWIRKPSRTTNVNFIYTGMLLCDQQPWTQSVPPYQQQSHILYRHTTHCYYSCLFDTLFPGEQWLLFNSIWWVTAWGADTKGVKSHLVKP